MLKLSIIGHLGADAVLHSENGTPFISMRVAHSESFTKADGTKVERTFWIDVVLPESRKAVLPWLKKGQMIFARGNCTLRCYPSEQARAWVASATINAIDLELLGSPSSTLKQVVVPSTGQLLDVSSQYIVKDCPIEVAEVLSPDLKNKYTVGKKGLLSLVQDNAEGSEH